MKATRNGTGASGVRVVRTMGLVGAVLLAGGLLSGCGDTEHEQRGFASPGSALMLRSHNVPVQVRPYDGKKITVDRWLEGSGTGGPKGRWSLHGHTLDLGVTCDGLSFGCGGRYTVHVPRATHTLRVRGSDGDVDVAGLHASVDARVDDGTITLRDVTGSNHRARTTDGDITASGLRGNLSVRTRDGSVHLKRTRAEKAAAHSDDGGLRLDFATPPTRLAASSRDGSVHVTVPKSERTYHVTGHTRDGVRSVDVPRGSGAHALPVTLNSQDGNVRMDTR